MRCTLLQLNYGVRYVHVGYTDLLSTHVHQGREGWGEGRGAKEKPNLVETDVF